MADQNEQPRDIQMVVFRLAQELFGLDIATVREIVTWQPITRIPQAPEFVEGIINLRGRLIPVVDLRKWLGVDAEATASETRIMVVEQETRSVGLIVDAVTEVRRVPTDRIEPSQNVMSGIRTELIRGIVKSDNGLIVLLEPTVITQWTELTV